MNIDLTKEDIAEMSENICLLSSRINSIIKYTQYICDMNIIDKCIIIGLCKELAQNLTTEIENISYHYN